MLLDRILTHIVNRISNTSYHLQYLSAVLPRWICLRCKTQLDNMRCGNFFECGVTCHYQVTEKVCACGSDSANLFSSLGYSQQWLTYTHLHAVSGSIMLLQHPADTLKKISVMHVIKLGFAPVSFPPG